MASIGGPDPFSQENVSRYYAQEPKRMKFKGLHLVCAPDRISYRSLGAWEKIQALFNKGPASKKQIDAAASKLICKNNDAQFQTDTSNFCQNMTVDAVNRAPTHYLFAKDTNGNTWLHHACETGNIEVINAILEKASSVAGSSVATMRNETGKTPLMLLTEKNNATAVHALIQNNNMPLYRCSSELVEALHTACKNGAFETVEELIAKYPGMINNIDDKGKTALHHAAASGQGKIVDFLLAKTADLHAKDNYGKTPTYEAFCNNHDQMGLELLRRGAKQDVSISIIMGNKGINPPNNQ